jgi:hypothetical protein
MSRAPSQVPELGAKRDETGDLVEEVVCKPSLGGILTARRLKIEERGAQPDHRNTSDAARDQVRELPRDECAVGQCAPRDYKDHEAGHDQSHHEE